MSPRPLLHKAANARMRASARHQRNAGTGSTHRSFRQSDLRRRPKGEVRRSGSETRCRDAAIAVGQDFRRAIPGSPQRKYNNVMAQVEKEPGMRIPSRFHGQGLASRGRETLSSNCRRNPAATYPVEIHVVRLGDLVVCSNPFELFCEYGIRIKARSQATQTFILQMSGFRQLSAHRARPGRRTLFGRSRRATSSAPKADGYWSTKPLRSLTNLWK